ncbi:hypothetical protein NBO_3g0015 [Nosema bombycis CQ1]|uniref:Secreted protein n=1 Tax=Nosema bombycis (strain CQ1 / CVCC 102059) TaxID=578461 RepID=R0MBY4_NOSB1|nr:hypothetical protein NBO_3g0015 [Nosema bombycis CQ1]|eukprot:EOB15464.1 hypothetical protein NBO_3g0015 [Nosema bombycis CQ1]
MKRLLMFIAIFFGLTLCQSPVVGAFSNTVKENISAQSEKDQKAIQGTTEKLLSNLDKVSAEGEEGGEQTAEGS